MASGSFSKNLERGREFDVWDRSTSSCLSHSLLEGQHANLLLEAIVGLAFLPAFQDRGNGFVAKVVAEHLVQGLELCVFASGVRCEML